MKTFNDISELMSRLGFTCRNCAYARSTNGFKYECNCYGHNNCLMAGDDFCSYWEEDTDNAEQVEYRDDKFVPMEEEIEV